MTFVWRLSLVVRAVVTLNCVAGLKTAVLVYDNDKCSSPATSVAVSDSLTCFPQANHNEPICAEGVTAYSVSDCIEYHQRGWDDIGVINDAFGNYSYLGVETYVAGRCGRPDSISSSMIYRLDENCYPNAAGTESHQLTLGHSAIISIYSDATCTNVASMKKVRRAAMGASRVSFCVDEMTTFSGGPLVDLTAVAVYDDNTCSGIPSQIKFSQDFSCKVPPNVGESPPCRSGDGSYFSISECTGDYSEFTDATFGAESPYVIVAEFPNPWCYDVEYATAYAADGMCHTNTDGTTSFRAVIDTVGSSVTISAYSDSVCTFLVSDTNVDSTTLSSALCMRQDCEFWFDCGRKYLVGGLGAPLSMGKKTAVVTYQDASCTSSASSVFVSNSLTCTPQVDHYEPICEDGSMAYSVSDCIDYRQRGWDDIGVISDAFGNYSYLGVETYVAGRCGRPDSISSSMIYRLDENCYPNAAGTESHQLTLGHSAIISIYSDATCTNVASMKKVRRAAMGASRVSFCVDEMTTFSGGPLVDLTAVAVYDDNTCSGIPSQIKFSQDFSCKVPPNVGESPPCRSGDGSYFSISECTGDYSEFTDATFGAESPYVIVAEFPNPWCYDVEYATAYAADGMCHTNTDDTTSFRAVIDTVGSSVTISAYSDSVCTFLVSDTNVDSTTLSSALCMRQDCEFWFDCGRKYLVGGLGAPLSMGKKTAVVTYQDASCTSSASSVFVSNSLTCTPQVDHYEPICEDGSMAYSVSDCIDYRQRGWDDIGVISDAFGNYSYLGVETYVAGRCGRPDSISSSMIYRLDENCYPNAAGTESHQLTLGHSAIISIYSDATCTNVASMKKVRRAAMGASRVSFCVDEMTTFSGGPLVDLTAVAVYDDNTCSGIPSQIKFSQDFSCKVPPNVGESPPCRSGDGSYFSISECTGDYSEFTDATFGAESPYVIVAEFPNPWCYDVEYATAYAADGMCHTNTDGTTSFRAVIDTVGSSVTISAYSDSVCTFLVSDTNVDSTTLSSALCMRQDCEFWFDCGRKYLVGGLGAPLSTGKKTAVVTYEDSSCILTPTEVVIFNSRGCLPSTATACKTMSTGPTAVFQARECIDDGYDFAKATFSDTPYLVVENYANGTNCQVLQSSTLYAADGKCHLSISTGNHFMVTQRPDGAVIYSTYPTSFCNESGEVSNVVENWFLNTGSCQEDRAYRTSLAPIAMNTGSSSNSTTSEPPKCTCTSTPTTDPPWPYTPTTAPWPTTAPPTPSATTPAQNPVSPEEEIEARLDIMFPAWLWDVDPPRIFVSDGRRRHGSADYQRSP